MSLAIGRSCQQRRIILNLLFLKQTNGMLYYATDYGRLIESDLTVVTRKALAPAVRLLFPKASVIEGSLARLFLLWLESLVGRVTLFTPTPHPLPFSNHQIVVVHDSYPFRGSGGRIKKWLFQLSLASSKAKVAYINKSDSKRFVEKCVREVGRHVFLPNHYPDLAGEKHRLYEGGDLIVGLVGTDSPKKNYLKLFEVIANCGWGNRCQFLVYGHDTSYFRSTCASISGVNVELLLSDSAGLQELYTRIHCLVSVARNEGFGRPIAAALACGVPCFLLDDEVFREFYDGLACFSLSEEELVSKLFQLENHRSPLADAASFPPREIKDAIEKGLSVIREL